MGCLVGLRGGGGGVIGLCDPPMHHPLKTHLSFSCVDEPHPTSVTELVNSWLHAKYKSQKNKIKTSFYIFGLPIFKPCI
jgi:hypothetical protein